ncbi:hypothetical protein B0H14DRAFT_2569394 [Mycena olivaceomarginata]|nr:hypothetical protein B0H14DRAFT_2569394 [Mycena olivaceomarginata]
MHVPQELVDLIVDDLHDDTPSLKLCSLIARAFTSPAQTLLFKKIEILPPKPDAQGSRSRDSPCQRFHNILTSSPHLAPLVHELHIVLVGSETSFDSDENGRYLQARRAPWIMSDRTLSLVLPLLNIKRISLLENSPGEWNGSGDFSMNWNNLEQDLQSALAAVFSSPTLESVHLRGIVVQSPAQLLSLFSEATYLTSMSISRIYFTQKYHRRDPWPESRPWCPQLRSLFISELFSDSSSRYLLHPRIDLSQIISLTIVTDWGGAEEMIEVIPSLQHLQFYLSNRTRTPLHSILTPTMSSVHLFTKDLPFSMPSIFISCPPESRLEKIILEGPTRPFRSEIADSVINSTIGNLSALRTVEIRAYLSDKSDPPFHEWAAKVRSALPSLVGRGLLTFTEIEGVDIDTAPHDGWE